MNLISKSDTINKDIYVNGDHLFGPDLCCIMAGPCAAESRDQIMFTAEALANLGIKVFRAGCFKSRTDPHSFQGAGPDGLNWLDEARQSYGLNIITEVADSDHFDEIEDVTDIIQLSSKAMYDYALLRRAGKSNRPVLMKRHFGATIEDMFRMADYILTEGNNQIMFCERGIRTFETSSRFTLDLCGAEVIKHESNIPVVLDPSHSMGYSYGVPDIARACVALGCEGLLIEVHHNPAEAKCDKQQAIDLVEFGKLYEDIKSISNITGKSII